MMNSRGLKSSSRLCQTMILPHPFLASLLPMRLIRRNPKMMYPLSLVSVSYQTHVQDLLAGQGHPVSNGMTAGTTGRAKRVEALKINLLSQDGTPLGNDSISVQSHISGIGWEPQPVGNGQTSGTVGQSRAIEASSYLCRAVFLTRMTFGIAFILQMLVGLAGPQMVSLLEHRAMLIRSKLFR